MVKYKGGNWFGKSSFSLDLMKNSNRAFKEKLFRGDFYCFRQNLIGWGAVGKGWTFQGVHAMEFTLLLSHRYRFLFLEPKIRFSFPNARSIAQILILCLGSVSLLKTPWLAEAIMPSFAAPACYIWGENHMTLPNLSFSWRACELIKLKVLHTVYLRQLLDRLRV